MTWDPVRYLQFADERARPGFDLLARVGDLPAGALYDLGCGTGIHARALAARWPERAVIGVDAAPAMLAQAAAEASLVRWQEADIAAWRPTGPAALIFSNAALHWLDDHAALLPRLIGMLAPGGVIAVQMPRNAGAPSHRLIGETVRQGPWAARLAPLLREEPVGDPGFYYDLLARVAPGGIDLWETEYLHVLAGPHDGESPVLSWTRGTTLRPLLAALGTDEAAAFTDRYEAALRHAYKRRPDGRTLFAFRRLFFVARARPAGRAD